MTPQEIDHSIDAWRQGLASIAQNLMDLRWNAAYERLAGASAGQFSGETAVQAESAVATVTALFEYFEILQGTIERAAQMRSKLRPVFFNEQRVDEIENLLKGRSIHLPATQVPMAKRGLLSGLNTDAIAPQELLNKMVRAYDEVKQIVLSFESAWNVLESELDDEALRLGLMRKNAARPIAELAAIEQKIAEIRSGSQTDPFGARARLESEVRAALDRISAIVARQAAYRKQVEEFLADARGRLRELEETHNEACAAFTDRQEKIAGAPTPTPDTAAKIQGLGEWLGRLETKYTEGLLEPVAVGLDKWHLAARACLLAERASRDANRGPLELRKELRGRMDALKAKARTCGVAENPALMELAQQADRYLYVKPTALENAAAAVASYETMLTRNIAALRK